MNAFSPGFGVGQPRATAQASAVSLRWAALGEAGKAVAMFAGRAAEQPDVAVRNFPALIRDAEPWRREAAEAGCADLSAIMEPGIAALLAINARGGDCRAAAEALWDEFARAREAVIALLPPSGTMGPRRSA